MAEWRRGCGEIVSKSEGVAGVPRCTASDKRYTGFYVKLYGVYAMRCADIIALQL